MVRIAVPVSRMRAHVIKLVSCMNDLACKHGVICIQ